MTGSGTRIEVIAMEAAPSVKVSPLAHSTPNSATMSPAVACGMSSSSSAWMRTSLSGFRGGAGRRKG